MEKNWLDSLEVYGVAVKFVGVTRSTVLQLRRTDPGTSDQLHRATTSIVFNLGEGAGEFSPGDKVRFYRYALRSAYESVAILDVCREIDLMQAEDHDRCRHDALRVIAMMTKLLQAARRRVEASADGVARTPPRIR